MEIATQESVMLRGTFEGHGHLRRGPKRGQMMHTVIPDLLHEFGGMVVMGNPEPPITNFALAGEYRKEINSATPPDAKCDWILAQMLTDETEFDDVLRGIEEGVIHALKYMPAHGTTNSGRAVTDLKNIYPLLEKIESYSAQRRRKKKIPVLLHGEVIGDNIDPFDSERIFVEKKMPKLQKRFSGIRFVLEHITTKEAAWYVRDHIYGHIYATATPQALLYTRKDIFQQGSIANGTFRRGLRPSMVCWPLLKEEIDRMAVLSLVASGNSFVGLGTDRAPHPWKSGKLGDCGAAGCYPGRFALGMYAMALESIDALKHFQNFACRNIPVGVYELPQGKKTVRLVKNIEHPYVVPKNIPLEDDVVVPMMHGRRIPWRIEAD